MRTSRDLKNNQDFFRKTHTTQMSKLKKPAQLTGIQKMPEDYLNKLSYKLHTSKAMMQQVNQEKDLLTKNRRNIRTILHDLEMDKMQKATQRIRDSQASINSRVETVEQELAPTVTELRVLADDFVRDAKFNPVQRSIKNVKKADIKYQ